MKTKVLLVSEKYIKENSALSDNYFGKYLTPAIIEAQDMGLQSILGSCLYEKLLSLVEENIIEESGYTAYKALLDDYVQSYLLYEVLSNNVLYSNIKLANLGTHLSNDEHVVNLSQKDFDLLQQDFKYKADFYCKRMQEWLLNNQNNFPELDACACEQLRANLKSMENCGLWLGGRYSKRLRD